MSKDLLFDKVKQMMTVYLISSDEIQSEDRQAGYLAYRRDEEGIGHLFKFYVKDNKVKIIVTNIWLPSTRELLEDREKKEYAEYQKRKAKHKPYDGKYLSSIDKWANAVLDIFEKKIKAKPESDF